MEQLVLSGDVRKNLVTDLATAKVILGRAVKKYAGQSTGGLARALACVEAVLAVVEPTSQDYFTELEKIVASLPAGPHKTSAERSLRALKAQAQRKVDTNQDNLDAIIETLLTRTLGPGKLVRLDLKDLFGPRRA